MIRAMPVLEFYKKERKKKKTVLGVVGKKFSEAVITQTNGEILSYRNLKRKS